MKITQDTNNDCLILHPHPAPDWDEFITWGKNILSQLNNCQLNQQDTGADLHKLTFTFTGKRFSLNYETYTDSYWIETDEPSAIDGLQELRTQLSELDIK